MSKESCAVCSMLVDFPADHPLHSTNWNLPNKQTFPVCSEECKQLLLDEYDIAIRRSRRQLVRQNYDAREKVKKIYNIVRECENADTSQIYCMLDAVESLFDKDDDYYDED